MMTFLRTDKYVGMSLDLYGEYCEAEIEVFSQILSAGQTVVEVGANIGAHTIPLAQLVGPTGKVFAFEPQSIIFQILCANVVQNEVFNVRTIHAGSGSIRGNLKVPYINYQCAGSNFGGVSLVDVAQGYDVQITPLDEFELPDLRLLKIDVEGMEVEVLQGAQNQIARHRPVLYVENDRPDRSVELISLIDAMGYDLWWHFARLFNQNNFAQNANNIFDDVTSINLICVPKEEKHSITGFRKVIGPEDWWEKKAIL